MKYDDASAVVKAAASLDVPLSALLIIGDELTLDARYRRWLYGELDRELLDLTGGES